jgi:hypothetical protein
MSEIETLVWFDPDKNLPPIVEEFPTQEIQYHGCVMGTYPRFRKRKERHVVVWGHKGKINRWMTGCGDGMANIKPEKWRPLRELEK